MTTKATALRGLRSVERKLRTAVELLNDSQRPITGVEFKIGLEVLGKLNRDPCFGLALLQGAPLHEILCAISETGIGMTKIAEARRWHDRDLTVSSEVRAEACKNIVFARSRVIRMIALINGDPLIMR